VAWRGRSCSASGGSWAGLVKLVWVRPVLGWLGFSLVKTKEGHDVKGGETRVRVCCSGSLGLVTVHNSTGFTLY
jgi:hypothetical protein